MDGDEDLECLLRMGITHTQAHQPSFEENHTFLISTKTKSSTKAQGEPRNDI